MLLHPCLCVDQTAQLLFQHNLTLTKVLSMLVGFCRPCWAPPGLGIVAAADPAGVCCATLATSPSCEVVTTCGPSAKTCTVLLSLLTANQSLFLEKAMLCMCAVSVPRRSSCQQASNEHHNHSSQKQWLQQTALLHAQTLNMITSTLHLRMSQLRWAAAQCKLCHGAGHHPTQRNRGSPATTTYCCPALLPTAIACSLHSTGAQPLRCLQILTTTTPAPNRTSSEQLIGAGQHLVEN